MNFKWVFLCFAVLTFSCKSTPAVSSGSNVEGLDDSEIILDYLEFKDTGDSLPVSSFKEVWAYLTSGNESALKSNLPISDIVYFGAEVSSYGHLVAVPKRSKLAKFSGRVHFSIACNSGGLTHFVIESGSRARKQLVAEIVSAAKNFDGLNVDMELVPSNDTNAFMSFLAELRAGIGDKKTFSVCVPAKTRDSASYNYSKIAFLADRVFVMAYDEHWSTSSAGPVASMSWCKSVADYALSVIGKEKLVMGIPFYGRAWGDTSTSRALINSTTEKIKKDFGVSTIKRVQGIPTFTYEVKVRVTVFYEDEYSLATRISMYRKQGISAIGFWRLGQETMGIWPLVNLNRQLVRR
jgi:spore germination protein YaaH